TQIARINHVFLRATPEQNSTNRTYPVFSIYGAGPCALLCVRTKSHRKRRRLLYVRRSRSHLWTTSRSAVRTNGEGIRLLHIDRAWSGKRPLCARHPQPHDVPVHDPRTKSGHATAAGTAAFGSQCRVA